MISNINRKYFRLEMPSLKKDTDIDMSGNCTLCNDTKSRLHLFDPGGTDGIIKCFNEGCDACEGMSLLQFLYACDSKFTNQYKQEAFKNKIESLSNVDILKDIANPSAPKEPAKTNEKEIPLDTLFLKAKDVPEAVKYLSDRNIKVQDDWYFSKEKFFEYNNKRVFLLDYLLIPIYNKDYKYRGFYSRSIKEKKFSTFLLPDTEKIWINDPKKTPDIICEGIFDAISSQFNNPAAMLGAGLSKEYITDLSRNIIIATDNDETGIRKAAEFLNLGFKVFIWPESKYKDFNEMSGHGIDIKKFILTNTFQGIMGKIKLGIKEK